MSRETELQELIITNLRASVNQLLDALAAQDKEIKTLTEERESAWSRGFESGEYWALYGAGRRPTNPYSEVPDGHA